MKNKAEDLSRRSFIKGTSVGVVGMATTGLLGGCTKQAEEQPVSIDMTADQYLKKWSFEIAPEAITDIAETIEAEIVVVGAGTSGLVTANSAADEGADVVLISASKAPISRGGSNHAVYSKTKERLGLEKPDANNYAKEIAINLNNVDQRKWYHFYNNSEEAMNWLVDIMEGAGYETGLEQVTQFSDDRPYYQTIGAHGWLTDDAHSMGGNQQFVVDTLAERLMQKGGKIYYKNIGRQLVRGGAVNGTSGRVEAVIAEREDGTFAKYVGTKAVVLATGDFSANREMMYKYNPGIAPLINDDVYNASPDYDKGFYYGGLFYGDGQKMGLWIGAAWQKTFPCTPMGGGISAGPGVGVSMFSGLLVNRDGERYMCENAIRDMGGMTNAMQPGRKAYAIWDTAYAKNMEPRWFNRSVPYGEDSAQTAEEVLASWDNNVDKGSYFKADTLEELIEAMGLPASTIDSVNRYNELAQDGVDVDFHQDPSLLFPITTGPFYGSGSGGVFLTILGGLRTNSNMQVCDEDDAPIEGLYNVGTMVGDMYAGIYTFQLPGLNYGATCLTFGYLTGKYIVAHE